MLISTRGRYALRILTDMAERRSEGYVKLKDLAQHQGLSEKYLESIVQVLVKNDILTGNRGKFGGYRFAREPEEITTWEVLTLTEGSLAVVECQREDAAPCGRMAECRSIPLWQGLDKLIFDYLSSYTISDLARLSRDGGSFV